MTSHTDQLLLRIDAISSAPTPAALVEALSDDELEELHTFALARMEVEDRMRELLSTEFQKRVPALEAAEKQRKELTGRYVGDLLKGVFDWSLVVLFYAIGTPDNDGDQELLDIIEQSLRERKLLTENGELDAKTLDDHMVLWTLEQLVDAQESLNQLLVLLYDRLQHRHYEREAADLNDNKG